VSGTYKAGDVWYIEFSTANASTGAAQNADTTTGAGPLLTANHNGSDDTAFALIATNKATGRYLGSGTIPLTYNPGDVVNITGAVTVGGIGGVALLDAFVLDRFRLADITDTFGFMSGTNSVRLNGIDSPSLTTAAYNRIQLNLATTSQLGSVTSTYLGAVSIAGSGTATLVTGTVATTTNITAGTITTVSGNVNGNVLGSVTATSANVTKWLGSVPDGLLSGLIQVDVERWIGGPVTAATAGVPDVNVKNYANVQAVVDQNNLPNVNVQDWDGNQVEFTNTNGVPMVEVYKWDNQSVSVDSNNFPNVNMQAANSHPITSDTNGLPNVNTADIAGVSVGLGAGVGAVTISGPSLGTAFEPLIASDGTTTATVKGTPTVTVSSGTITTVTGNVLGNVLGSVGSVTAPVGINWAAISNSTASVNLSNTSISFAGSDTASGSSTFTAAQLLQIWNYAGLASCSAGTPGGILFNLQGAASFTVTSPYNGSGTIAPLVIGASYLIANNNPAAIINLTGVPSLVGAALNFGILGGPPLVFNGPLSGIQNCANVSGVNLGSGSPTLTVEFTSPQTTQLGSTTITPSVYAPYPWLIQAALSNGNTIPLVGSVLEPNQQNPSGVVFVPNPAG